MDIHFPFVVRVEDYHEFDYIYRLLKKLCRKRVRYEEFNKHYNIDGHFAVFYGMERPSEVESLKFINLTNRS